MSAADGFLTPAQRAARARLEQRYRRLLRLYPHEFRARRAEEMLGVLMASAADGQDRPGSSDVADVVRGSLVMRLRGPRGGWSFTLAAFALVAPLFLVLTDILQVAFPYWESQASWQRRVSLIEANHPYLQAHMGSVQSLLAHRPHVGGLQLLSQPVFLILVAGHLIVAAAVLGGLRRTALAALVIAAAADATHWTDFLYPGSFVTTMDLTVAVFLLEAVALAAADPRAARRREGWQHLFPALVLAIAAQAWALAFDAFHAGGQNQPLADTFTGIGFVLIAVGVLLPLPLGLGWRVSLLLAAACDPIVLGSVAPDYPRGLLIAQLTRWAVGPVPATEADAGILAVLYLPPLLVLSWAVAKAARARRTRSRGDLAA